MWQVAASEIVALAPEADAVAGAGIQSRFGADDKPGIGEAPAVPL